jgi:hypothetical protein
MNGSSMRGMANLKWPYRLGAWAVGELRCRQTNAQNKTVLLFKARQTVFVPVGVAAVVVVFVVVVVVVVWCCASKLTPHRCITTAGTIFYLWQVKDEMKARELAKEPAVDFSADDTEKWNRRLLKRYADIDRKNADREQARVQKYLADNAGKVSDAEAAAMLAKAATTSDAKNSYEAVQTDRERRALKQRASEAQERKEDPAERLANMLSSVKSKPGGGKP